MLRRLIVILLLCGVAFGQQTFKNTTFIAAGNNGGVRLIGSAVAFIGATWTKSGTVTVCSFVMDSSTDGITWNNGDVLGATSCATNGQSAYTNAVYNYVRVRVTSFTGTGSVTIVQVGYINNPAGGSAATTVATTAVSNNADYFPIFVPASADGNQAVKLHSNFTYNPFTGVLTIPGGLGVGTAPTTCGTATGCLGATAAGTAGNQVAGQGYFRLDSVTGKWLMRQSNGAAEVTIADTASTNAAQVFTGDIATGNISGTSDLSITGTFATSGSGQDVIAEAGTLTKLYVLFTDGSAPANIGVGDTFAVTVYKNHSATTLTCTVGNSSSACNDTAHTASFVAGDRIGYHTVCTGAGNCAGAARVSISIKVTYP